MSAYEIVEGYAPFGEYETWFRVSGDIDGPRAPLVILHGGPGCSHDYLASLSAIANSGRAVIHYDQIGGGRSTLLPEKGPDFWTVDLFLDELDNLLEHLGIADQYDLLGQSWGGMLAAEHAVRRPRGLGALVISNSPASMELWAQAATALRSELPPDVASALDRHEAAGTFDDPEYLAATQAYYDEHVCRVVPNPPDLLRTMEYLMKDATVYNTMNGPNEFFCIGTLKEWTIVDRLSAIIAPTLVLSGFFDEAQPIAVEPFVEKIEGATWTIFERSSHMPFLEEPDEYRAVVEAFLAAHD